MPYMVTWIPSIYPLYVSIYTSTMDPMGYIYIYTGNKNHQHVWWLKPWGILNLGDPLGSFFDLSMGQRYPMSLVI